VRKLSSLWAKTVQIAPFPALEGDISTDVLIIGGGMAGLLCAYMLDRAGADYLLVEENTVGSGVTGCTTAKLTAQHGLIYHKLIKSLGEEKAAQYLQVNLAALDTYGKLCSEMDCDYSVQTNWVYEQWDRELLVKELTALKQLGYPGIYRRQPGVPVEAVGAHLTSVVPVERLVLGITTLPLSVEAVVVAMALVAVVRCIPLKAWVMPVAAVAVAT
jgi:hypothetical protein